MRFFKRQPSDTSDEGIRAFWAWWPGVAAEIGTTIPNGSVRTWADQISKHVHAIDDGLAWELSKGTQAAHALAVSPEGDPAIRSTALRWLAAAPQPDDLWEFYASRQPGDLGHLLIDDVDLDLADFRAIAGWDESRQRVDVRLWHPDLASLGDGALRATYLFLDNLLGEDAVERWIGTIDVLSDPTGGRTPAELKAEIDRRAAEATGESWVLAAATDARGNSVLLKYNAAIKPIDYPFCRFHLAVTVDRGIEQLANRPDESEEVNDAEDRLVAAITADQESAYLGHVTEAKRRIIHLMCSDEERANVIARDWAAQERRYSVQVKVSPDPGWTSRREVGL